MAIIHPRSEAPAHVLKFLNFSFEFNVLLAHQAGLAVSEDARLHSSLHVASAAQNSDHRTRLINHKSYNRWDLIGKLETYKDALQGLLGL